MLQSKEQMIIDFVPIKESSVYVDIGSGSGHLPKALSSRLPKSSTIYAIDIRKEAVEHLAKEAKDLHLENVFSILADAEIVGGIPLVDGSADVVVISHALPFMHKKDNCFLESKRLLKDGGFLVIIESNFASSVGDQEILKLAQNSGFVLSDKKDILDNLHTRFLFVCKK